MITKKCEAPYCIKPTRTNSAKYCEMHYMRERRHGDITQVRNHSKIEYRLSNGYNVQTKEIFIHLQNIAKSIKESKILSRNNLSKSIRMELGLVSKRIIRRYLVCILDNSKPVKDKMYAVDVESFCNLFYNNKNNSSEFISENDHLSCNLN